MRLRCIGNYSNPVRNLVFGVGQEFDAPPELATFLASDAPGCFESADPAPAAEAVPFEPLHSAIDEAPANRAVGRPRKRGNDESE